MSNVKCPICDQAGANSEPANGTTRWFCGRCGTFLVSGSALPKLAGLDEQQRGSLSINTRAVSNVGAEVTVTTFWIDEQLEAPPPT